MYIIVVTAKMICKIVQDVLYVIRHHEIVRSFGLLVIFISVISAIFFSSLSALVILTSYIFGFIVCWSLITYQKAATLYVQRFTSFYRGHVSPKKRESLGCLTCENATCNRHPFNFTNNPWKALYISENLNTAIRHFYNKILDNFVISWYDTFTHDITFPNELRVCLRYATASVLNKFLKLNKSQIITDKLVPCAIKHIDDYLCMQQIAKLKNVKINDVTVEYLGCRLHAATTNRSNELSYLGHLTSCLLPNILPPTYLKCRNYSVLIREIISGWVLLPLMDVLADPYIINSLVVLATTYKSKGHNESSERQKNVEFLSDFVIKETKHSSFSCDLKTVLKTTDLLYAFMQFLKREGPVHILQFCLHIEDFNNKLLTPDLSKEQLENLHAEASNLYKIYFNPASPECIGCSLEVASQMKLLLEDGVYNVAKLRTSEPLYHAYDHAFSILENEYLLQFFHSNEFYNYLAGSKVTTMYTKIPGSQGRRYENSSHGTVAKISSGLGRIRGALKTNQPVEGALYPPELHIFNNDPTFVDDLVLSDYANIFRDLSAWRISIASVESQQISGSKPFHIFNINVQRIDTISENEIRHWIVQRKDQDFFTLKAKLIEFHGENEISDSPLPSRKVSTPLEIRRAKYEDFLRSLLQKPSLRSSDLLHTFLTVQQDFALAIMAAVPVVEDLGNIYQSVAFKLRKEKGQHLDGFMNTFLGSIGKSKYSKFEWAETVDEADILPTLDSVIPTPKTFKNLVFNDNFGVQYKEMKQSSCTSFSPNGISESIFYLLKHTFKVPQHILKLYAAICSIAQQAVESACRMYIDHKLRTSLSQANLTFLVNFLEETVFQTHIPNIGEVIEKRKIQAFNELNNSIPSYISKLLGHEFKKGAHELLDILQNPVHNKQLAYSLLDIIVAEMYPHLDGSKSNKICL